MWSTLWDVAELQMHIKDSEQRKLVVLGSTSLYLISNFCFK